MERVRSGLIDHRTKVYTKQTPARAGGGGDADVTFAIMCLTQDKGVAIVLPQGLRKRH